MKRSEIKRRYTRVIKMGDSWECNFQVGVQGFTVCEGRTKHEANWYADMLTVAIEALLQEASNAESPRDSR